MVNKKVTQFDITIVPNRELKTIFIRRSICVTLKRQNTSLEPSNLCYTFLGIMQLLFLMKIGINLFSKPSYFLVYKSILHFKPRNGIFLVYSVYKSIPKITRKKNTFFKENKNVDKKSNQKKSKYSNTFSTSNGYCKK